MSRVYVIVTGPLSSLVCTGGRRVRATPPSADLDRGAAGEKHDADDLEHHADADHGVADVPRRVAQVGAGHVVEAAERAGRLEIDQAVEPGDRSADHQSEAGPVLHLRADLRVD